MLEEAFLLPSDDLKRGLMRLYKSVILLFREPGGSPVPKEVHPPVLPERQIFKAHGVTLYSRDKGRQIFLYNYIAYQDLVIHRSKRTETEDQVKGSGEIKLEKWPLARVRPSH